MQATWRDFLQQQGATFGADGQIDFADQPPCQLDETPLLCPLSGFAVLQISGDDCLLFLNGQLTNDLTQLDAPGAQISAWCNPKGRVISNFIIIYTGQSYLLIFKAELKDDVKKRLETFVLRANVSIEDITDSCPLLGIANVKPRESETLLNDPGIIPLPDPSGRLLNTGTVDTLKQQFRQLKTQLTPIGSETWALLDILAGLPWITSKTREQFLPQTLNLDLLAGMSYQKGCYPGQEIIARLHYRGAVKKRVKLIRSAQPLKPGVALHNDQTKAPVATILNTATHPNGDHYALAVITLVATQHALLTPENQAVTVLDLTLKGT